MVSTGTQKSTKIDEGRGNIGAKQAAALAL
jgi:hypothetical protein